MHVPQDRAYTYDKLILSPTCLSDKSAVNRIRGYQRYLRTEKNKKRVVNPISYPSTSFDLITSELINKSDPATLLFVNEDLYMHETYLFLSYMMILRSILPQSLTFQFLNLQPTDSLLFNPTFHSQFIDSLEQHNIKHHHFKEIERKLEIKGDHLMIN